jgi:hypothetical protein
MSSISLLFVVTTVAISAFLQKEFNDEQRATMGSFNSFVGSIFFGIVAVLVGICCRCAQSSPRVF